MKEKELSQSLDRLSTILERRSKAWNVFLTGVLNGIGTAIGAALIGSLIVGLIASNINKIPFIKDIIPQETLGEFVENGN